LSTTKIELSKSVKDSHDNPTLSPDKAESGILTPAPPEFKTTAYYPGTQFSVSGYATTSGST